MYLEDYSNVFYTVSIVCVRVRIAAHVVFNLKSYWICEVFLVFLRVDLTKLNSNIEVRKSKQVVHNNCSYKSSIMAA